MGCATVDLLPHGSPAVTPVPVDNAKAVAVVCGLTSAHITHHALYVLFPQVVSNHVISAQSLLNLLFSERPSDVFIAEDFSAV